MNFDIPTMLIAVVFANMVCALTRVLFWSMHPTIPGLGRFAIAGGAGALALLLILIYGIYHWYTALSIAQGFVVIGLVLAWDSFRRFSGAPPLQKTMYAGIGVLTILWLSITQFHGSIAIRALGNIVIIFILSTLIAHQLLKTPKPRPLSYSATGWIYALNSLVFLIRLFAFSNDAPTPGSLNPHGATIFMLLWWLFMTIAVTLGMILMTSQRLQADLDYQAHRDPLTGALNRRAFSVITENALAQSQRYNKPLSILMMDLDKFKKINDSLGHNAGDVLLCRFVSIANQVLRDEDSLCRFGGEEFVALLPNTSADMALLAAERLRHAFEVASDARATKDEIKSLPFSVSIGIAQLEKEEDIEALLRRADEALYQAKDKGRNCCELS